MTTKQTRKKSEQLGINFSTATARLKKELMFSMAQRLGDDWCFQCGERIETSGKMSVEHKVPWLDKPNAKRLFYGLDNIAFSHLTCNVKAGKTRKKYATEEERKQERNKRRRERRKATCPKLLKKKRREQYLRTGK